MTKKHLKVVTIIVSLAIVFCSLTVNADTEPMDTEVIQEGYTSTEVTWQDREPQGELQTIEIHTSPMGDVVSPLSNISYGAGSIPNGIYSFENLANYSLWMDIQNNSTTAGSHVQQYAFTVSPAISYYSSGLFKVTQVGSTGRYIIRLVSNESLSFGFSGNDVVTKTIPAYDSAVSAEDTFYITYDGGAYTIIPYGSTYCISANDTRASGSSGAPDSYLSKRTLVEAGDRARWIPQGYACEIPTGVYAFKNVGNSGRWMDTERNAAVSGYHMQQYAYGTSPTDDIIGSRGGLFKISEANTDGYYVVRSMLNNKLSFGISGTYVLTKEINPIDLSVAATDTYKIVYYNLGYVLRPYGSESYAITAKNTSASGQSGAPDSFLTYCAVADSNIRSMWTMEKYTGGAQSGATITAPRVMNAGDTVNIRLATWSTLLNANECSMFEHSEYTDKLTGAWDNSNGYFTAQLHMPGEAQIGVNINRSTLVVSTVYVPITITLLVDEGVYFFQNKKLGSFMQIDDNDAPDYNTSGVAMELHYAICDPEQKWSITHLGDGYYKIISKKSGLALAVRENYLNSANKYLTQETYSDTDRMKWKLTQLENGAYVIRPKSGEAYSSDWCMSASTGLNENGRKVEQREYTNDTDYKDEWSIIAADTYVYTTLPARIYYSSNCSRTSEELEEQFNIAVNMILAEFNILFDLEYIELSTELDPDTTSCVAQFLPDTCTSACGALAQCDTLHHRGGGRLFEVESSDAYYTCRIVEYRVCFFDATEQEHSSVLGVGNLGGKDSTVSEYSTRDVYFIIAHELSHNLTADHTSCVGNANTCILFNSSSYKWCAACSQNIHNYRRYL